jgi:hypothetical protein
MSQAAALFEADPGFRASRSVAVTELALQRDVFVDDRIDVNVRQGVFVVLALPGCQR